MDVTARIHDTLSWMVLDQGYRTGIDNPQLMTLTELLLAFNWSPEMHTAIETLSDLRAGRIRCIREAATDF